MDAAFIGNLFAWSNAAAVYGLNLFIHTSVVILAGLAGAFVLTRMKAGAAALSLVYRMTLCAVLAIPVIIPAIFSLDLDRFYLAVRLPSPRVQVERNIPGTIPKQTTAIESASTVTLRNNTLASEAVTGEPVTPSSPEKMSAPRAATHSSPAPTVAKQPPVRTRLIAYAGPSLFALWVFLSLFLFLRASVILVYVRRIRKLASPARPEYAETCREVARELGTDIPVVLQSPYVTSTFITGIIRPAVLLPLGANESSMASREVFLHELAHLIRRDHIWLLAGQAVKILFPLQPLLWILMRRFEEAGDYACDNYVLNHTGQVRAYATRLFDLALSIRPGGVGDVAGAGILTSKSPLRRRIEHILDNSYARHIAPKANETMSMALLFVCAVTLTGFVGIRSEAATDLSAPYGHGGKSSAKPFPLRIPVFVAAAAGAPAAEMPAAKDTTPPVRESAIETIAEQPSDTPLASDFPANPAALSPTAIGIAAGSPQNTESPVTVDTIAESVAATLPVQPIAPTPQPAVSFPGAPAGRHIDREPATGPAGKVAAAPVLPPSFIGLQSANIGDDAPVAAKAGQLSITVPPDAPGALRESLERGQENPVWSPSGQLIAFTGSGGNGIWAVSVQGGRPGLVYDTSGDPAPRGNVPFFKTTRILGFTPDGRELTFARYTQTNATDGTKKEAATGQSLVPVIESIDLKSGEKREIVRDACEGCWSPDGRYFIYGKGDSGGIYTLDRLSGTHRMVTGSGKSPAITPDGATIIYVDWSAGDTGRLFRAPVAGGTPVQLVSGGFWLNPKISPDGVWVLCSNAIADAGSYARFMTYNLSTERMYDIMVGTTESAVMGDWSPRGGQYCCTLYGGAAASGSSMRKSAISIGDFHPDSFTQPTAATMEQPAEFKLFGNFPNPFNPSTAIRFSLPADGITELVVYGMNGQKIRELISRNMPRGTHSVMWNGRDESGKPVSSGVYIARLKMNGKVESRRMTLVK